MKILLGLLFPFCLIYGWIIAVRNLFFDWGIFDMYEIPGKSIGIGNLNVGGSGKSPLTLYLMKLLQNEFPIYILSRGYGRTTKGYFELSNAHTASEVGDEPLMYFQHTSENDSVHVCEKRRIGLEKMGWPKPGILLLDDVFQHRAVHPGLSILVTDFSKPFFTDYVFPMGRLRESRKGVKRASMVIFTKCPDPISEADKARIKSRMQKYKVPYFFSHIVYPERYSIANLEVNNPNKVLLVSGIANPKPLIDHLKKTMEVIPISFGDHHRFSVQDIEAIHKKFDTFENTKTIILTTEKDFMRLKNSPLELHIKNHPWYVQPMSVAFEDAQNFLSIIYDYVN